MSKQNTNPDANKKDLTFAEKFGKKKTFSSSQIDKENIDDQTTANNNQTNANNKINESNINKKAVDPQKRALAQYIYLVRGVDAGRNAWYYVLVERLKVQLFLKALNDEIIHLEKYGKILYSAYGDEPPANVTQAIKDEYGIN
jgi:hypothetical protein